MNDWSGSNAEQEWSSLLASCSSYSDFTVQATLGANEGGQFVASISNQNFADALQQLVQMTCWTGASSDWEYIIETFYTDPVTNAEICEWHNRHSNHLKRYKSKDLNFMRLNVGWSGKIIEVKSQSKTICELNQPLPTSHRRLMSLRQRRSFILADCIYVHCDLLSERGPILSPRISRRCITLEIPKFDTRCVNLLHMNVSRFLIHLQQFVFNIKLLAVNPAPSMIRTDPWMEGVQECVPLIHEFRSNVELELEGRLGELKATLSPRPHYVFVPGISREKFFTLLQRLDTYQNWSNTNYQTWQDSTDIYWGNLRGTKTRETSMVASPMTYIVKQSVADINLRCPERQYGVRVSLKKENKVPAKDRPLTPATYYRIKRRRSFIYQNSFRYDFTIIGMGETEEAAILSPQDRRYEVEIELLRTLSTIHERPPDQLILSLLEKLTQLLDRDEGPCTLQVAHDELAPYDT